MTLLRSIGRVASSLSIPIASFSFAALVVSGAHYCSHNNVRYLDNFSIYKGLFHIRGPDYVYLNRDEDFLGNERLFEEADRDLEKQLQRFKPLIEKQL